MGQEGRAGSLVVTAHSFRLNLKGPGVHNPRLHLRLNQKSAFVQDAPRIPVRWGVPSAAVEQEF